MKDWHKQILVYLASRKTRASPENIKQYLKRNGISKSHTAITTACKEPLSDILIRHDQSLYDDNGVVKRKRFQYSLKNDITSLNHIVYLLNDHDLQQEFLRTQYYRNRIPELVHQFHTATREQPLTEDDEKQLTRALKEEENWLTLKWVVHFISVTEDERNSILRQLLESVRNPYTSPTAARAEGLKNGFCDGVNASRPFVTDIERMVTTVSVDGKKTTRFHDLLRSSYDQWDVGKRIDDRTVELKIPPINWRELFHQLEHFNSNYPYLFD